MADFFGSDQPDCFLSYYLVFIFHRELSGFLARFFFFFKSPQIIDCVGALRLRETIYKL